MQDCSICVSHQILAVPKVNGTGVGDEAGCVGYVPLLPAEFRYPYHVNDQILAGVRREDFFLYFGGPPKTVSSSRAHQQEQTRFSHILIKPSAQCADTNTKVSMGRR